MDTYILYRILGQTHSIATNKELTQYAIQDYSRIRRKISNDLASICQELLFQSYSNKDEYCICCMVKVNENIKIQFDITNIVLHGSSTIVKLSYTKHKKLPSSVIKNTIIKDIVFKTYDEHAKHNICTTIRESFDDLFRSYKVDMKDIIVIESACTEICFDKDVSHSIFNDHNYDIRNSVMKETPFLSQYTFEISV